MLLDLERKRSRVRVGVSLSRETCFICLNESPSKIMKNANVCLDLFGHPGKRLDKKAITSQNGK